jgi:hypothetical protein
VQASEKTGIRKKYSKEPERFSCSALCDIITYILHFVILKGETP